LEYSRRGHESRRPSEGHMSYVNSVLQPGERVVVMGRLHWIIYWLAIVLLALGLVVVGWLAAKTSHDMLTEVTSIIFAVLVLAAFMAAWFKRWTTEIAVTDKRVIVKTGFITRHTVEMNMDKVSSVDVDQSLLGRILDYGTIQVIGTGGTQNAPNSNVVRGIENLRCVAHPLALRSAITAK
jgi:uncharacterized membrane protein YdbT with pleckstrin-like domain